MLTNNRHMLRKIHQMFGQNSPNMFPKSKKAIKNRPNVGQKSPKICLKSKILKLRDSILASPMVFLCQLVPLSSLPSPGAAAPWFSHLGWGWTRGGLLDQRGEGLVVERLGVDRVVEVHQPSLVQDPVVQAFAPPLLQLEST